MWRACIATTLQQIYLRRAGDLWWASDAIVRSIFLEQNSILSYRPSSIGGRGASLKSLATRVVLDLQQFIW